MIRVDLDVMLARRKMSLTELSQRVGITMANLSILKNGRAKAVRFETLEAICRARGFIQKGGVIDLQRGVRTVLDEFRGGKIGKITLEMPSEEA